MNPTLSLVSPSLVWIPWIPLPSFADDPEEQESCVADRHSSLDGVAIRPQALATQLSAQDWRILQHKKILVMGSGQGSNFEALTRTLRPLGVQIGGVFCNRPQAGILDRARRLQIPIYPVSFAAGNYVVSDDIVLDFLDQPFDLVVLAGYMKILSLRIVERVAGRILNLHPSLLPQFPGLHAIQRAWESRGAYTGVTVHEVDQGVDTGTVLAQAVTPILPEDTLASLEHRIHRIEHLLYPWVVARRLLQLHGI